MNYTEEFKTAVEFSTTNKLFLGYGNPNGKILIIGKEHYFPHRYKEDTDEFYEEIVRSRENENNKNAISWNNNIKYNFSPDWESIKNPMNNNNAYTAFWHQRNVQNKQLKNGKWNDGTSNTYLHYQKIYQNVFLNGDRQERINFQKVFFVTELNDLPSKKSYNLPGLKQLRKEFITKRRELFDLPFFKSFPVVIIAAGHYPSNYGFDIEKSFDVNWSIETEKVGKSWYNLHYNKDKKRILIHTRQLSTSVSNELLGALSYKIKDHSEIV